MKNTIPRTPFSTPLSGSARETELRLRNIFSGPKKRPPALFLALVFAACLLCGNLVSCNVAEAEPPRPDIAVDWENLAPPDLSLVPVDWENLPEPTPLYTLEDNGNVLIEGLEGAYAEWHRHSTGNYLYFGGDPAFCCPSLAGRAAEGSANWQDEDRTVLSVSLSVNDGRLEDGTIEGYCLRFTVDCNKWEALESEFTSEVGDGTLVLSEREMGYAARVLAGLMWEAEWTASADVTVLPQQSDLNRNGVPEELRLFSDSEMMERLDVLENGSTIYSKTGYYAHAGYTSVFLCTLDGEDYLLSYFPTMYQGSCNYGYELYTLEKGVPVVVRQNSVAFDINFGAPAPMHQAFDPEAIDAFMKEINSLLANSAQLLNTDGDLLETFEKTGRLEDDLWWLDGWGPTFTRDPEKTLLENLTDFQDAMIGRSAADDTV